jgi:RNA polymerase sigma-70 factor (ECF subfamily)
MHPGHASAPSTSGEGFAATRWSLVAAASVQDAVAARRALIELCLRYWFPVYSYVRGCGHTPEVAQDITRGFFEDLLQQRLSLDDVRQRGRFREFLLNSLNRFLNRDWRNARECLPIAEFDQPLPWTELESRHLREVVSGRTPEQTYQRSYALEVLGSALTRLRQEAEQAGHRTMFEAMEAYLSVEPAPGQFDELARQLGIRPLATVLALKRLRQRFRELADSELAETVTSESDLAAERAALARALGQP